MLATLFHCLDLLRLSGTPADVAPSRGLLWPLLAIDCLLQALVLALLGLPQLLWLELMLARIGGVWLMLRLRGHPARLLQTLTALSGVSLLLTAALLAATLGYGTTQQAPALMQFFEMVAIGLVGWLWLAGGLVLARALSVPMPFGVAAMIALQVLPQALRLWLTPVGAGG